MALDGWQVGQSCYANVNDSFEAWKGQFPMLSGSNLVYPDNTPPPSISAAGVVSFRLVDQTGQNFGQAGSVQLPLCDTSHANFISQSSVLIVFGMVLFLFLGFYIGSWIINAGNRAN